MKTFSMENLFQGVTLVLLCMTIVPIFAQDVDLLKEIDTELRKIKDSLNELEGKFDLLYPTTISPVTTVDPSTTTPGSTATTPESTATTPGSTVTTPESTATTPGSTVTTPESTATTPESTATTPGSTATTPESTATTPGSTATTSESTATTPESTATTPGSTVTTTTRNALKVESESFTFNSKSPDGDSILRAEGTICVSASEDDLCGRLIDVLNEVEGVADDINSGNITENQLDRLKSSSVEMKKIVSEADKSFISQLDPLVFKSETERIQGKVSIAIDAVDDLIPYEGPALVIVMGVLGGLVFLSFFVLAVYIARQSSQRKKKEQQRKLNETRIPTEPSAEEGNVNKGFVEEELPKVAVLPRFGPHSGNVYKDSATRGKPFKADSMDRREDRRPSPPPAKNYYDDDDMYSLERRGAYIKRTTTPGGLRRYDL